MREILSNEINNEKPNSSALGGFNDAYDKFIKIAKSSINGRDFVNKARNITNVPKSVANRFSNTYGKGNVSMETAAQRFVNKFK